MLRRVLCIMAGMALLSDLAWATKPQGPLRLSMVLANTPKPGEKALVEITVDSLYDFEKLSLRCELPSGLKLEKDQKAEWELKVQKGLPAKVSLEVVIPDTRSYRLIAKAVGVADEKPVGAVAKLEIALGDEPEKAKTQPNVLETKDGEKLRLNKKPQ
jgi:hypothetical protein